MSAAKIPLDQTYHYPPELLEMLIDAIPCLFKSKQGVIDFFHGAGTPAPFLTKWRSKVKTDRDSFTKYDIVRDTENDAHKRGKALESALNDLFKNCGILIKEAFTYIGPNSEGVLEQVDGAVEIGNHLYLVEMKWWAAPLGRADVSPHLVKLFSRADARGIIISSSDFTGPAIETVREAISLKTCVLCELKEIVFALENDIDLGELFRRKVDAAVTYKQPFHRIDTV